MYKYNPKVSIVIPAYNASNYLAEAIDSALAQTYPNIEIIVVNDGSADNGATAQIAASYGDKIRYFHKENGGSSSALNMGISNMEGEWFSWLSHDDLYLPGKVEEQIKYLNSLGFEEEELKAQVLFAASRTIDGQGKILKKTNMEEVKKTACRVNSFEHNGYLICEPSVYTFHGCSCFVHKSVFDSVGMFDKGLRYLNDWDIWFRIYSQGYKIHFLPQILVCGRIHGKQVSKAIGYSYNNPEQDFFWNRSFNWLCDNYPDDFELFFRFGRNAYLKSRPLDGDKAFQRAVALKPKKKSALGFKRFAYKMYCSARNLAKRIYISIRT